MSDFEKLINASDLIEWIMETYPDWCVGDVRSIVEHVEEMPSAQPDLQPTCNQLATDCISRQAAIDEIEERKNANGYRNVAVISELNRLEGYIMRLPSVQPESKRGKWIKERICGRGIHRGLCSCCGFDIAQKYKTYKFCPNCGAWMEEGGE